LVRRPITSLFHQLRMIENSGAFSGLRIVRETEVLGENLPQCHFFRTKISHDLTWDIIGAVTVGSRRLTACTVEWALFEFREAQRTQNCKIWWSTRLSTDYRISLVFEKVLG
jgi:hypothetical protein